MQLKLSMSYWAISRLTVYVIFCIFCLRHSFALANVPSDYLTLHCVAYVVYVSLRFYCVISSFFLSFFLSFLASYPQNSLNGTQPKPATCLEAGFKKTRVFFKKSNPVGFLGFKGFYWVMGFLGFSPLINGLYLVGTAVTGCI